MLAENETERQRWVGALNELQKLLRKNKLPSKSVSQKSLLTKLLCVLFQCFDQISATSLKSNISQDYQFNPLPGNKF